MNYWQFGGGVPPPGQFPWGGGGASPPSANIPWWVAAGAQVFDQLGGTAWLGEWLFGTRPDGGGSAPAGNGSGVTPDLTQGLIAESHRVGGARRAEILQYYNSDPNLISKFADWLKTFGTAASIISKLIQGSVFDWPVLLQDLIILFFHDTPKANEIAPGLVADMNASANVPTTPGGGYLSTIAALRPATLPLVPREAYRVPKGYVLVTDPVTKQKAVVLKELAKAAGLYKARARAPIKASEWKAAKKAKSIESKLSRMLSGSCNFKVTKKR